MDLQTFKTRLSALEKKVAEEGVILTERQIAALERKREAETEHPGYLGSQDRFYVGTLKGVGCIYQQTFVDSYSRRASAKLYTAKAAITAADLLNDRVLPFFEDRGGRLLRVLAGRGTEFCGRHDEHAYQLVLAINDIDHTKTTAKSTQTNGICERFHKTVLHEFYQVAFRKKLYTDMDELQKDLDAWLMKYNEQRAHQGKICCGRTPMQTFGAGMAIWRDKEIHAHVA